MNTVYLFHVIADALKRSGLGESVLVGNMGAAVYGAGIRTDDFDYVVPPIQDLPQRIQAAAAFMGAVVLPPKRPYGTTTLYVRDLNLRVDLMRRLDGIRSYRALRTHARVSRKLRTVVASLRDIIRSKRAAGRPKDLAVLPELEATLHAIEKKTARRRVAHRRVP